MTFIDELHLLSLNLNKMNNSTSRFLKTHQSMNCFSSHQRDPGIQGTQNSGLVSRKFRTQALSSEK